jgi:hypothetical protein
LSNPDDQPLSADLLIGAEPIAEFLGMPLRETYHALQKGYLPTFKIGPKHAARKSELRARLVASYAKPTS